MTRGPYSLRLKSPSETETRLFTLLSDYVQSTSIPAATVAQSIHELGQTPISSSHNDGPSVESFLWETWAVFIDLAKQLPSNGLDRLVDVLQALTAIPVSTVTVWESKSKVWTDFPILGPSMREAWINTDSPEETRTEWVNLNSFAARLLASLSVTWVNFAVWTMRDALENRGDDKDISTMHVDAATEWVLHAGKELVGCATSTNQNEERALAGGKLYHGPAKMCAERWDFWKKRFGEVAEAPGDDRVKAKAKKAQEAMEAITIG
ncbi:hypothetical protein BDW42DRAFT_190591 [Aspergillus taichungensis]|uniref:Uncharacterized protein n=1 Tax=Aspergillus taichungensis TaxID=482145 RepID=A0A2J5I7F6_9EURO|nr:hypothetical protein BDW42DRAFT_190591 [Aspergillus taichungensis]